MLFFFIPFVYTFHTRLKSNFSKVAWFFTYVIPVLIASFYFYLDLFFSFLLIISIYSAYEIGYIYNDCEVTKREKNPTLRLSDSEILFYNKKTSLIYFTRLIFLSIFLAIVFIVYRNLFLATFLVVLLILLIYVVYNNMRNNLNLPLYSLLVFFRYFAFFPLLMGDVRLGLILFLTYPLCVSIEFSTKNRFLTSQFIKIKDFDRFRVGYYSVLLFLSLVSYFILNQYFLILFILSCYFFIYRLVSFIFLSKKFRGME